MNDTQHPAGVQEDPSLDREPDAPADADQATQATSSASSAAGESTGTEAKPSADAAFESFLTSDNLPNDPTSTQDQPGPAQAKAEDPPSEDQAKAPSADDDSDDDAPTEAEQKSKQVPVSKLQRALNRGRKLRETLNRERAALDGVITKFEDAGIQARDISGVLTAMAAAKRGDTTAISSLKQRLGIRDSEAAQPQGYSEDVVAQAIRAAVENIDAAAGMEVLLKARPGRPAPSDTPARTAPEPKPEQQHQQVADPDERFRQEARAAVMPIANAIRSRHGAQAEAVGRKVEEEAARRLSDMQEAGAQINAQVMANVYRRAMGTVEEQMRASRAKPPTAVRSSPSAPPTRRPTADEQFESFIGG